MEKIAKIGAWEVDFPTMKSTMTAGGCAIFDITEEVSLSEGLEFFTAESKQRIEKAFQKLVDTGESYDLELNLKTKQGHLKKIRTVGQQCRLVAGGGLPMWLSCLKKDLFAGRIIFESRP